jgi:hypothetical protein
MMRDPDWFFIPGDADDGKDDLNLAKRTITLSKANEIIRSELSALKVQNENFIRTVGQDTKRIKELREENERLRARCRQIGYACEVHDLTHAMTCARCREKAEKERDALQSALKLAVEALEFYADLETNWEDVFDDDGDGVCTPGTSKDEVFHMDKGDKARAALEKIKELG